jgi:hypothetical protein
MSVPSNDTLPRYPSCCYHRIPATALPPPAASFFSLPVTILPHAPRPSVPCPGRSRARRGVTVRMMARACEQKPSNDGGSTTRNNMDAHHARTTRDVDEIPRWTGKRGDSVDPMRHCSAFSVQPVFMWLLSGISDVTCRCSSAVDIIIMTFLSKDDLPRYPLCRVPATALPPPAASFPTLPLQSY